MFLQLCVFASFITSLCASATFDITNTPLTVYSTPANNFYDPEVVISNKDFAVAFLYDATEHAILYSTLPKKSTAWSQAKILITGANGGARACIDGQGFGAVCCPLQDGNVGVIRFEMTSKDIIYGEFHSLPSTGTASAPVVCVCGPNKQVLGWKTNNGTYYVGFSPKIGSFEWNILPSISANQGKAEDFCLVGNPSGDCVLIWNNATSSNYGQYYSQRVNVNSQSLEGAIELPGAVPGKLYQYEGFASMSSSGDVLFSWTYGKDAKPL